MAFKVAQIIDSEFAPDYAEIFKQAGADIDLVKRPCNPRGATEDEVVEAIGDADAVITSTSIMPFSRKVLAALPNCRFIMGIGIGFERLDVGAATEFGIMAANVPDASLPDMSDHAMALILACTRKIVRLNEVVKRRGWVVRDPYIRREIWPKLSRLQDQTLGLIGFGGTARSLVPKAKAFGMSIIAYARNVPLSEYREYGIEKVAPDELLARSDIVSLHVPLTQETRRLIGLEQFRKMKPTACLINTARGGVVDSEALYLALTRGLISCAAIDVTDPEPLPRDSPLLDLDNLIITAHSAGASPQAMAILWRRPAEEILRVAAGEWPHGLINPEVKGKIKVQR